MIRRYGVLLRACLMIADAGMALAGILAATQLRFGDQSSGQAAMDRALPDPTLFMAAFVAAWVALLWARGLYRGRANWTIRGDSVEIIKADVTLLVLTLSALFLLKLPDVSRLFLLSLFPSLALAALVIRLAARLLLGSLREHGRNVRYMLVLGANARAKAFADLVESHAELGLVVIGHLQAGPEDNGVQLRRPLLGSIDSLEDVLHSQVVDEVAICLPFAMEELIEQTARLCGQEGRVVRIPVAPVERVLTLGRMESFEGIGVYSLANGPDKVLGLLAKRIMDIVLAAVFLVVLAPVFILVAVAIKLDSPGSVFFRQQRVGLHGRPFSVMKFRTMCTGAEEQLDDLRGLNVIRGQAFKIENDPRITRVGRFLRRASLDELPQLQNVFRGDMSLVGPRPPLPCEVAQYDIWHRRRLSMKPGMTGLWQVGARREADFDRWVEADLQYIDSWSLWLDFRILAKTVPAVLSGQGR
jgi:exopolysaccharide biosynthesis polyprenyl glycosylphosphotransferase